MAENIKESAVPVKAQQYVLGFDPAGNWCKDAPASASAVKEAVATADAAKTTAEAAQATAEAVRDTYAGINSAGLAVGQHPLQQSTGMEGLEGNITYRNGKGVLFAPPLKTGTDLGDAGFGVSSSFSGNAVSAFILNGFYRNVPTSSGGTLTTGEASGILVSIGGLAILINLNRAPNLNGVFLGANSIPWMRIAQIYAATASAASLSLDGDEPSAEPADAAEQESGQARTTETEQTESKEAGKEVADAE